MASPDRTPSAATALPPEVTNEDALAAYLERIQNLLCSFTLTDQERRNSIASVAHNALLNYGGGYTEEARARRERNYKVLAQFDSRRLLS